MMMTTIFESGFIVPTNEKLSCKVCLGNEQVPPSVEKSIYLRKPKTQPDPCKRRHQLKYHRKHIKPALVRVYQIPAFNDRDNEDAPY